MTLSQKEAVLLSEKLKPAHLSHLRGAVALPEGTNLDRVYDLVRYLVTHHETLRSRYFRAEDGEFRQEVLGAGAIPVRVAESARRPADAVLAPDRGRVIEFTVEPRGRLSYVASHLVADGWANSLIVDRMAEFLRTGPGAGTLQPADQAARETTPQARALQQRSLAYWLETHGTMREPRFPTREPAGARYRTGVLSSPALYAALPRLSTRYRVGAAPILLAAFARALAAQLNRPTVPIELVYNNRPRPEQKTAIGQFSRHVPLVVDVGDESLETLARTVSAASLKAYRYAYYDPADLPEEHTDTVSPRFLYLFNCLAPPDERTAAPGEPGTFRLADWEATEFFGRFVLIVRSATLDLICDTAFFPPTAIEESLRGIETELVRAAF